MPCCESSCMVLGTGIASTESSRTSATRGQLLCPDCAAFRTLAVDERTASLDACITSCCYLTPVAHRCRNTDSTDCTSQSMADLDPQHNDVTRTNPQTLVRWIVDQQRKLHPETKGNLSILLGSICVACKFVASAVRKAGLAGLLGLAGSANIQGEDQKKLDILANEVFVNMLTKSGQCNVLVSEENDEPIIIEEENRGQYCVVMDPLDGSSNIDCGVSIGTIFGIYKAQPGSVGTVKDVLRPGREMVAAGYCMYGSNCCMVMSLGNGCSVFTLDPSIGEFVLTAADIKIPSKGDIYSINEGNTCYWEQAISQYVHDCKFPGDHKPRSLRYVGSMVADVHRTILYGGIFLYPADSKSPSGKLRLLYECFPMAYLVEQAGGSATTGIKQILDIVPTSIHQRSPIHLGSKEDVHHLEGIYNRMVLVRKSF